jgi:hypothetical protein
VAALGTIGVEIDSQGPLGSASPETRHIGFKPNIRYFALSTRWPSGVAGRWHTRPFGLTFTQRFKAGGLGAR